MKQKPMIFRFGDSITFNRIKGALAPLGKASPGEESLAKSVYFDTFDWRLFAASKSLFTQTGADGEKTVLFDHRQRKPVASARGGLPCGFASGLPKGALCARLKPIAGVRRLLPNLEITSRQRTISVQSRKGKIILRLSLERLHLRSLKDGKSAKAAPFGARLALLPRPGHGKTFHRAKRIIEALGPKPAASTPLHIEGSFKTGSKPAAYSSKPKLLLDPKTPAGKAVRIIHLALLEVMEQNEDGIINNLDSEFLHDFRTAIRRTRSALNQIGKGILPEPAAARMKDGFRWLAQQTSHLRDLDVYLIEYPKLLAALPASYRSSLEPFHGYLVQQGAKESEKVKAMLKGRRYQDIRDEWRAFLCKPAPSARSGARGCARGCESAAWPVKKLADGRIWKAYQRLLKEGEAIGKEAPAKALHELRLTGKALRYLMEFFQTLYPRDEITRLINEQKALQAVLGEFQDAEVQAKAIPHFGRQMAKVSPVPLKTQIAMGMAAGLMLRRQQKAERQFHHRFKKFSRPEVRKAFARLFKP